ncbi:MAG: dTMP kinase [Cyanobacteriota bacterium]|nr:dTMP kinase [Cyanobacteriota bacterium]
MKGKLIVFEGVEGAGKTTQMSLLSEWLEKQLNGQDTLAGKVVTTREPGGTELGKTVRRLLLEPDIEEAIAPRTELLLYAADRAQHVQTFILPHLEEGNIVLCDRFTDSTIAYQGYGRGLTLELINQLNRIATVGIESNLTLWFDLDVETGLSRTKARGKSDRMERATVEFHRRVQQGFQELAETHPHRIRRVDASGAVEEVQRQVREIVKAFLF